MDRLTNSVLKSLMSACLMVVVLNSTEAICAYREDIREVERVLKQAATESQQWHIDRDTTDRFIHDIAYFIEQSWKAAETSNHSLRKDHAKRAEALLLRSMRMGHFDIGKVTPILKLIEELQSDQAG